MVQLCVNEKGVTVKDISDIVHYTQLKMRLAYPARKVLC